MQPDLLSVLLSALLLGAAGAYLWRHRQDARKSEDKKRAIRNTIQKLRVADLLFQIPTAPIYAVHAADGINNRSFTLQFDEEAEQLCARTNYGQKELLVSVITLRFSDFTKIFTGYQKQRAARPFSWDWSRNACARGDLNWPHDVRDVVMERIKAGTDESDYPLEGAIFALVHLGQPPSGFGGMTASTYDDSLLGHPLTFDKPGNFDPGPYSYTHVPDRITPDGNPLTIAHSSSGHLHRFQASYCLRDGVHIHLVYLSTPSDFVHRGKIVYDTFSKMIANHLPA